MRDLSGSPLLLQAQQAPNVYAPSATLQFSKTRGYSDSIVSMGTTYGNNPGMNGSCLREDSMTKDGYIFTVYVEGVTDNLIFHEAGETAFALHDPDGDLMLCDPNTKPALFEFTDTAHPEVNWVTLVYITSASVLMKAVIDLDKALHDKPGYDWMNCVIDLETGITLDYSSAALHIASLVYNDSAGSILMSSFFRDRGAIGVDILYWVNEGWTKYNWLWRRFIFPGRVVDDYELPMYSCSTMFNGKIHNYMSDPDTGAVKGVIYDPSTDGWSNTFVSIPSDNSIIRVTNALVVDGAVYISAQYTRTGDYYSSGSYNMLLKSYDGVTFSFSRDAIFSSLCYRFYVVKADNNNCIFVDNARTLTFGPYMFGLPDASTDITVHGLDKIVNLVASGETCAATLSDPGETLFDSSVLAEGCRMKLFLGYKSGSGLAPGTSASALEILYGTYRVQELNKDDADARRIINISAISESQWLVSSMAFPFYTEIISKSAVYDDFSTAQLYAAPNCYAEFSGSIAIDLWGSVAYTGGSSYSASPLNVLQSGGVSYFVAGSGAHNYGIMSQDIVMHLGISDYPEWQGGDVLVKIYAWSESNEGGADPDTFTPVLLLASGSASGSAMGTERELLADDLTSTYAYPSSSGSPGSYPIIWTFSSGSFFPGDQIKSVALLVSSTGSTTFCPERIKIEGFEARRLALDPETGWTDTGSGLLVPGYGHPYIMLSQKPYMAVNFDVEAEFHADGGRFGCVGAAYDSLNWVGGIYDCSGSAWEIVKCVDGKETVLATQGAVVSGSVLMMFSFRDAKFWVKIANVDDSGAPTWQVPIVVYEWTEADGVLDISGSMVMHVGIYGFHDTLYFETPSFDIADGNGIVQMPMDIYQATGFPGFPSAGSVVIDSSIYTYQSKTLDLAGAHGPYQYRNISDWQQSGEPDYFKGLAVEIGWLDWCADYLSASGLAIGSSSGHTWIVEYTNWQPWTTVGGAVTYQHNRSRWFSGSVQKYSMDMEDRIYVGSVLEGLSQISGSGNHGFKSKVYLHTGKSILCNYFAAVSGEQSNCLADLIDYIVRTAGGDTRYPKDITTSASVVSQDTGSYPLSAGYESLDVTCVMPILSAGSYIGVKTNICPTTSSGSDMTIALYKNLAGDTLYVDLMTGYPRDYIERIYLWPTRYDPDLPHTFHVFISYHFASVYVDGDWVITFCLSGMTYPVYPVLIKTALCSNYGGETVADVVFKELYSWREDVYIEMESSGQSAVSSIIQERPVEIDSTPEGNLSLSYNRIHDAVTLSGSTIRSHGVRDTNDPQASSDAILIYLWRKGIHYADYAENVGFATRSLQLPNLSDSDVDWMAEIILTRAYQRRTTHNFTLRPDFTLERDDEIAFAYNRSSTGTAVSGTAVVEQLQISLSESNYTQNIIARDSSL